MQASILYIGYTFQIPEYPERRNMLHIFRKLSLIEGSSLIILLLIAMPAKYQFGLFDIVWLVGMIHGVLWLAYITLSLTVSHKQGWSVVFWIMVLMASVIPFACFFLDSKLRPEQADVLVSES